MLGNDLVQALAVVHAKVYPGVRAYCGLLSLLLKTVLREMTTKNRKCKKCSKAVRIVRQTVAREQCDQRLRRWVYAYFLHDVSLRGRWQIQPASRFPRRSQGSNVTSAYMVPAEKVEGWPQDEVSLRNSIARLGQDSRFASRDLP